MHQHRIHHLPAADKQVLLVGLICATNLCMAVKEASWEETVGKRRVGEGIAMIRGVRRMCGVVVSFKSKIAPACFTSRVLTVAAYVDSKL